MSNRPSSSSRSGGIGFFGALFIVFLVLKLTHVIDWSWWWVTAPLWGSFAIIALVFLGGIIVAGIRAVFFTRRKK